MTLYFNTKYNLALPQELLEHYTKFTVFIQQTIYISEINNMNIIFQNLFQELERTYDQRN